jgi:hypothetical protein
MANQTKTKSCNHCNQIKPISEFYKKSASKDGLQPKCKICVKEINEAFRYNNPKYQTNWQRINSDKWTKYVSGWAKQNVNADDKRSALYYITNPDDKVYIGSTQTLFSQRKSAHKIHYKNKTRVIPLLHDSFDIYGWDAHKWTVIDMAGVDRETLRIMEYAMINHYNKLGMSLNVRLK